MSYYYGRKRQHPPQLPASPQRAGHYAGLHDESQPFYSDNLTQKQTHGHHRPAQRLERLEMDEIEEAADIDGNGDVWPPQVARSAIRYTTPGQYIKVGSMRYELHPDQVQRYPNIPQRSSRAAVTEGQRVVQQPPAWGRGRSTTNKNSRTIPQAHVTLVRAAGNRRGACLKRIDRRSMGEYLVDRYPKRLDVHAPDSHIFH